MWGLSRVRRDLVVGIPVFLPVLWIPEVDLGHGDQKAMRHACCLEMKKRTEGKRCCGKPSSKLWLPALGLHALTGGCVGCRPLLAASDVGFCWKACLEPSSSELLQRSLITWIKEETKWLF